MYLARPKLCDIPERGLGCNIIDHDNAMRSFVIRTCYRPESLLPCSVPYLQLHLISIQVKRSDYCLLT